MYILDIQLLILGYARWDCCASYIASIWNSHLVYDILFLVVLSPKANDDQNMELHRFNLFLDRLRVSVSKLGCSFPLDDFRKWVCPEPSIGAVVRIYGGVWGYFMGFDSQYFDF